MAIKTLPRVFLYNGTEMADPLPGASPAQCLEVLAVSYPALTNAMVEKPVIENGKQVFNLKVAAGTKG